MYRLESWLRLINNRATITSSHHLYTLPCPVTVLNRPSARTTCRNGAFAISISHSLINCATNRGYGDGRANCCIMYTYVRTVWGPRVRHVHPRCFSARATANYILTVWNKEWWGTGASISIVTSYFVLLRYCACTACGSLLELQIDCITLQ